MIEQQARSDAPPVLSAGDLALYRQAFALQKAGKYEEADRAAAQATDPLLKGVLLGERYLVAGNTPNFSELALWLTRYSDHPQAGELYRVAREHTPGDADFLPGPQATATLKGFSNGQDASELPQERDWVSGLAAFRRHDMTTAAAHFKALLKNDDDLSSDDHAAAAFWAYRAAVASGDTVGAARYVAMAAGDSPGFYSILARQVMGERRADLNAEASDDIGVFLKKNAVRRAMALKAIGQDALAEKELRCLFPGSSGDDRKHLVQLARMLSLPAAQMRMAVAGNYDTEASDTQYPLPHWAPVMGYKVEPALLFAIMRQESGFNPNARSASGAMGVMQLMPATAQAMALDTRLKLSGEPAVSMTLGQRYLERLMDISDIGDNFIYVIAAYNAGPGNILRWQKSMHAAGDPLLFIESLPKQQTRDYVVHVMGNYWVYAALMGGESNASVEALAAGRWPHYARSESQMASMVSHLSNGAE